MMEINVLLLKVSLFVIKMFFFCWEHILFFTTPLLHVESQKWVWVCVSLVWGMERLLSSWWPGSLPHRFLWVAEVDWPQIHQNGRFSVRTYVALQPAAGISYFTAAVVWLKSVLKILTLLQEVMKHGCFLTPNHGWWPLNWCLQRWGLLWKTEIQMFKRGPFCWCVFFPHLFLLKYFN